MKKPYGLTPALALFLCLLFQTGAQLHAQSRVANTELMTDLMRWATRFSGLGPPHLMPAVFALTSKQLMQRVCPEDPIQCRTLVSVYDTDAQSIYIQDSLDLEDDTDLSFLVHEMVHHLQYENQGDELFSTCENVKQSEAQAYRAQNKYLSHFKQWRRAGEAMRFIHCDGARISGMEPD